MDRLNILSLLGLSLRGGRLAVGEEPVEAVARARDARVLLLAADAAEGTAAGASTSPRPVTACGSSSPSPRRNWAGPWAGRPWPSPR
ncbi:MAG: hypothetical protein ACLTYN_18035 [Dysosmobacter welbionis]